MSPDHITISSQATGARITTGAVSANAAIPVMSSGELPRYIRVSATVAASVRIGKGAQTALATDLQIQPGEPIVLSTNGADNIAAIQVAAAGSVQVHPLENM